MQKVTRFYKDYNISNTLLFETFFNYIIILMTLFGPTIFILYVILTGFHQEIIKLFTIYK